MQNQLDRIEEKMDRLDRKLDNHLERIARAETSIQWLKWTVSLLLGVASTAALALAKYVK